MKHVNEFFYKFIFLPSTELFCKKDILSGMILHVLLTYPYRRRILTQINRGEARHSSARFICHGQRGEIRKRYRQGQEDQLSALGLVTNAVILWNTIYIQKAIDELKERGFVINEKDISRLSPLQYKHINVLGHYSFTLNEEVAKGGLRNLHHIDYE